ncbi:hypothetical protein [Sphingobacterium anhuiense]|uniref:hypothetical protein n=1 Tax=Sphingobacterium anhuiense TaxID=493780 RepID=UPI003C30E72C
MTAKATNKTEEIKADKDIKECFIITPIGSIGSEIFNKTEGLINSVLKPVLEKFNFIPIPAHHINDSGSINKQIIDKIVNCELVIANLTSINPNVMYELAIRHSFGKKVITMAENGTKLPFDIVDQRTIFYEDSMIGVEKVKPLLDKAIYSCLNGKDKDEIVSNPIYDAINQIAAIKDLPKGQQDGFAMLMNRLDKIEGKLQNPISQKLTKNSFGFSPVKSPSDFEYIKYILDIEEIYKNDLLVDLEKLINKFSDTFDTILYPKIIDKNKDGTISVQFMVGFHNKFEIDTFTPFLFNLPGFKGLQTIFTDRNL